jgi:head-tail adaptor
VDAPATVLIRYQSDVDTACAVLKGSLRYEIVSIDNIQERSEYLELRVQRMKAG